MKYIQSHLRMATIFGAACKLDFGLVWVLVVLSTKLVAFVGCIWGRFVLPFREPSKTQSVQCWIRLSR
jgi:hypothetical protein